MSLFLMTDVILLCKDSTSFAEICREMFCHFSRMIHFCCPLLKWLCCSTLSFKILQCFSVGFKSASHRPGHIFRFVWFLLFFFPFKFWDHCHVGKILFCQASQDREPSTHSVLLHSCSPISAHWHLKVSRPALCSHCGSPISGKHAGSHLIQTNLSTEVVPWYFQWSTANLLV